MKCDRKGAVALIIWQDLFLLQLRENKPGIKNPGKWALFGGGQKLDETLGETIVRELTKEIGFKPDKLRFLEVSSRGNAIYAALLAENEKEKIVRGEGQAYGWFPFDQLSRLDLGGELSHYLTEKPGLVQDLLDPKLWQE